MLARRRWILDLSLDGVPWIFSVKRLKITILCALSALNRTETNKHMTYEENEEF